MNETELPERLRRIIDRYYRGSVNAAARDWRVPQPSLKRMVDGTVKRPGAEVLLRIANCHGTTVEWLLTGEGGPDPIEERPFPVVERERWVSVVGELDLPPDKEKAVVLLPGAIQVAYQLLCWEGIETRGPGGVMSGATQAFEGMWEGQGLEYMAWETLFRGLIDSYGIDAVRRKLIGELPIVQLGFQGFATWLTEIAALQSGVTDRFQEYAPTDKLGTDSARKKKRAVLPLEALRSTAAEDANAHASGEAV